MEPIRCIRAFADHAQIQSCRETLTAGADGFSLLSRVLELAGNEVRLKILYLLHTEEELCPCDLSDILQLSIPAVSQHLRKLKDGNVIKFRKEGQTIYYSLRDDHLEILRPFFKFISRHMLSPEVA
jgi:DNA-binding transcriptional ArsR family regulator